ncbi:MAG: tetratricopeptide repeat protein [Planctomycetes bacterium]|nr:tetratricopeptide repeat protein [Planctomycetota bacterium]NUQ36170.1 tetratricopeptide repeat protein [Planctomycetaceae bacterium]
MPGVDDVLGILDSARPDVGALLSTRYKMFPTQTDARRAHDKVAEWTGSREKQGIYLYLVGQHQRALRVLEQEASSEAGKFFLGLTALELNLPQKARDVLKECTSPQAKLYYATALVRSRDFEQADKAIISLEKSNSNDPDVQALRAEYYFRAGQLEQAAALADQTLAQHPGNLAALFIGGLIADRCGDDDTAIKRYERLVQHRPSPVDALLNLGVLYEDRNEERQAMRCYREVLALYPDHARAKMYLKDAEASLTMYYDEDKEKREDKRMQVLRTPVSDFELSVRSRNCLSKMDIITLGDLIEKSETELLSYKNFGETSLQEIKAILASRGLRLGMRKDEALKATSIDQALEAAAPKHEGILAESLDALDLSVRARKCMERMNLANIGQLVEHTEQQLMTVPNFGATSLIEVKRKLAQLGLSLKT